MQYAFFEGAGIGVGGPGAPAMRPVAVQADTGQAWRVLTADGEYLDPGQPRQRGGQMAELAREILVDKQDLHVFPLLLVVALSAPYPRPHTPLRK
ncbi:hypothetical protein [Stutzerimonas kirkiae]|uniref:hypothetical protein n=1 Tax=Stutzerimonas kirkiae TaxID=2211392 RepID=UPI001F603EF2|nr:hypothetical protein [Stutzerimonas kirkiae]